MKCKSCDKDIPEKRLELGFKKCVDCSDTEKYGVIDVTYHKTGNTIEITNLKTAEMVNSASKRTGYGVMRGMKRGSRSANKYKPNNKNTGVKPVRDSFVGTKKTFEDVGNKAMLYFDLEGINGAYKIIDKAEKNMEIDKWQAINLRKIFNHF